MPTLEIAREARAGSKPGVPGYAAPEVTSCRNFGVEVDGFAAGVVLYFIMSVKLPFHGVTVVETLVSTRRCKLRFSEEFMEMSNDSKNLIRSLLWKDPGRRLSAEGALNHPMFVTD